MPALFVAPNSWYPVALQLNLEPAPRKLPPVLDFPSTRPKRCANLIGHLWKRGLTPSALCANSCGNSDPYSRKTTYRPAAEYC